MSRELTPVPKAASARRGAKVKGESKGNLNGQRGKAFERKVAKEIGGKRVPTSGAGSIKGDVLTRYVLAECKMTAKVDSTGGKVMQLKREWLIKMRQEAQAEGKLIAVLPLHFLGDSEDYAVMPMETLTGMLKQLEGLYALGDWLERNPHVAGQLPVIEMPALGRPLYTVPEKEGEAAA